VQRESEQLVAGGRDAGDRPIRAGPDDQHPLPPLLSAVIPISPGVRTMAAVTSAVPSVIRSQSPGGPG
jgi:hypothetical protein